MNESPKVRPYTPAEAIGILRKTCTLGGHQITIVSAGTDGIYTSAGCFISFDELTQYKFSDNTPCGLKEAVVDAAARTVECEKCGVALDSIQCLVKIAYEERALDERAELIRAAIDTGTKLIRAHHAGSPEWESLEDRWEQLTKGLA